MIRLAVLALFLPATPLLAGYSAPNFIDGGQSSDGRYVVTAECTEAGKTHNGPNTWKFVWKDTQRNLVRSFKAQGVQGGQVYGQLFVPPGGETFALFNHVVLWTEGKSNDHAAGSLPSKEDSDAWRTQSAFDKRLIVYSSTDGRILKELKVADFLLPEEWEQVSVVFNRVHWIADFAPLSYRSTPRPGYAFYRVSPDYSILEVRIVPLRIAKDKSGRAVRVRLADGAILGKDQWPTEEAKVPVRPFLGPDKLPDNDHRVREGYVPSLDPVRKEGVFAVAPVPPESIPQFQPARLVKDGFAKADTPSWHAGKNVLVFTDLESGKRFHSDGKAVAEAGNGGRGRFGPDGVWYGTAMESLVAWPMGAEKPNPLAADPKMNDVAVGSNKFAYVTTLKDPEKGRLTIYDTADGKSRIVWDAEKEPTLANPNGVALSPDGLFLYVAVSSYKEKKHTGVYRFPVLKDGGLDVAEGRKSKWYNAAGPDGLAVDPAGNVYVTVGGAVAIVNPQGKKIAELKIPKGSGTNLCLGGADGKTLFVTTNAALYAFDPKVSP
jgi:hypothetical protein